jgi:hypothetical protein
MNESTKAREFYHKMLGMKGKFTIEFHNLSTYAGATLEGAIHHWDEATGTGKAEVHTRAGKILFDFSQVKNIS